LEFLLTQNHACDDINVTEGGANIPTTNNINHSAEGALGAPINTLIQSSSAVLGLHSTVPSTTLFFFIPYNKE
jgi:hypothetical protein